MEKRQASWRRADRLLCIRLDSLGDVLMTGPALRALKEAKRERSLTLLTSSAGAAAAALLPWVDDIIVYDAPWLKATAPRVDSTPEYAMAQELRGRGFDGAVIFTVYSQNSLPSAFLCFLADIPLRLAHCRENPYQLLTDWVKESEPEQGVRHEVRRQLDLVAAIGCRASDDHLALNVPPQGHAQAKALLAELGLDTSRPWAVVHPGASAPSRRYPPESFAAASQRLAEDFGWQILFTGSTEEVPLVEQIRGQMTAPAHSSAGRLDLGGLAALLAMAPLMISNNTGPAHMAAAVGTPVVDLYALTNPQHSPWGVPHRLLFEDVPCRNCYKSVCPEGHHKCLRGVSPDSVVEAAVSLYEDTREAFLVTRTSGRY